MAALLRVVSDKYRSEDVWLSEEAPAKVNLTLAVHGRRDDGFHALTSLVVACEFRDTLDGRINLGESDVLSSDGVEVPLDSSNLILKAAAVFRKVTGSTDHFDFRLTKRIPIGAGLGGGSSDGVAALKLMDALSGTGLGRDVMLELAAQLGSDCPFFVDGAPALMCGRGERIEPLDEELVSRLKGQRLVLFRPSFGIDTGWAYGCLAAYPDLYYTDESDARGRVAALLEGGDLSELLQNVFESAVGRKFIAIPVLLEKLRARGHACLMSGSGSCCFALVKNDISASEIVELSRKCWGERIFWVETSIC